MLTRYWVVKVRHRITRVGLCAARHEKTKRTSSKQKQSTDANSGEETVALRELASFVNNNRDYFGDLLNSIKPLQGVQVSEGSNRVGRARCGLRCWLLAR